MKKIKTSVKRKIIFKDGKYQCLFVDNLINSPQTNRTTDNKLVCKKLAKKPILKNAIFLLKTFLSIIIILLLVFIPPHNFARISNQISQSKNQSTFLKLWHIDSFEGGSGNRANFLNSVAVKYHNQDSSCFVFVQTLSEDEAINAIKANTLPDLISFSHHISNNFCEQLLEIEVKSNARAEIQKFAQKSNKNYAIPWFMSGYCLIGNSAVDSRVLNQLSPDTAYAFGNQGKNPSLAFTAGLKNSFAQVALTENTTVKANLNLCDKNMYIKTPYQAYTDFIKNEYAVLLGTARDFYRIQNRVNLNSMQGCSYVPLPKFSDLIQYIGILNEENKPQAENFIEFLTDDKTQRNLIDIGLFSPNNIEIYCNEEYKKFEKAMKKVNKSISIFESVENKQKLYKNAINSMC